MLSIQTFQNGTTVQVTKVWNMFTEAFAFNAYISEWDTSQVSNVGGMFQHAHAFDADISKWDTGQVTSMRFMFAYTHAMLSTWTFPTGTLAIRARRRRARRGTFAPKTRLRQRCARQVGGSWEKTRHGGWVWESRRISMRPHCATVRTYQRSEPQR